MGKSTIKAHGEVSPPSVDAGALRHQLGKSEPRTPHGEPPRMKIVETPIEETWSVNEPGAETTGTVNPKPDETHGTLPEQSAPSAISDDTQRSELGISSATQLMAFIAPSRSSAEASLPSENLIDSSLAHLHGLMKQVGAEDPRKRTSAEMVNAVCNVAREMRSLMKLKFDVLKEARGTK